MRSEGPPLMPVFRSRLQADLLTRLLLHPGSEYSMTELARELGLSLSTVHGEMTRLADAGILRSRSLGRQRLFQADPGHPAARALTELVAVTFGPRVVVAEEFAGLEGADLVILFGSWAARYEGIPGAPPRDVDVLVVGPAARADVYAAADRAQARLGLPVNPVLASVTRWREASDALIRQIKAAPRLVLVGREAEGAEA